MPRAVRRAALLLFRPGFFLRSSPRSFRRFSRQFRRRFFAPVFVPVLVLFFALSCALSLSCVPRAIGGKPTPPPGGTLLFVGQDLGSIDGYTRSIGIPPAGVTAYAALGARALRTKSVAGLRTPNDYGAGTLHAQALLERYPDAALAIGLHLVDNLELISAGAHDAGIDFLAGFLKDAGRPVFLRIGYEFDGAWNHYDPVEYKAAFRYIVHRLRARGVTSFVTVWQSATYGGGRFRGLPLDAWYPGDDVVDWCGSSYFRFARAPHEELLRFARARGKQVMIAEAAPQGYDLAAGTYAEEHGAPRVARTGEQIWAEWYAPFFAFVRQNGDVVRAVSYIDCNWNAQPHWGPAANNGYWGDTRIEANAVVKERWVREIGRSPWAPGGPGVPGALPHPAR